MDLHARYDTTIQNPPRLRLLLVVVSIMMCPLQFLQAQFEEDGRFRYHNEELGFNVVFPAGWEVKPGVHKFTGALVKAVHQTETATGQIMISAEDAEGFSIGPQIIEAFKKMYAKAGGEVAFIRIRTIDGVDVLDIDVAVSAAGMRDRSLWFVAGRTANKLTVTAKVYMIYLLYYQVIEHQTRC